MIPRVHARVLSALCILGACLLASAPAAQPQKVPDAKIERKTELDKDGMQSWAKWAPTNCLECLTKKVQECLNCVELERATTCAECKGTKKAACHTCAGKGAMSDPLEFAPCPTCNGHAAFPCYLCGNEGSIVYQGGGSKGVKCSSCKGKSGLACSTCKGKRLVKSGFRGKIGDTDLKKLRPAKKNLEKLIAALQTWEMTSLKGDATQKDARKSMKAYVALFKNAQRDFPELKKFCATVQTTQKALIQPIKEIERRQKAAYDRYSTFVILWAKHQIAVIDLCIARLEFNDKVEAGK